MTKYVTKPVLKTYVAFDAVRLIFQKNTEIINSEKSKNEKARKLMTKVVNSLSGKSEMGSPMICMYLLNHPNHYTKYNFINFHWPSYVKEVENAWNMDIDNTNDSDKISIIKHKGRIVGLSPVQDYIHRGSELESMSLHEWVSRCKRIKLDKNSKKSKQDNMTKDEESLNDHINTEKNYGSVQVLFKPEHPLYDTHVTLCAPPFSNSIPNFIGGTLPRRDSGDRDTYCRTMLTLFKPWRSGLDLKDDSVTWNDVFNAYSFSKRQLELMKNMNIRYVLMLVTIFMLK